MGATNTCIVVTGPYRSGTSLASQVLSGLGVEFGNADAFQLAADRYNPGGYFQRKDVVEANNRLIQRASSSIALPAHPETILAGASEGLFSGVDLAWSRRVPLYGLKDPRFCATLLTWIRLGILPRESTRLVRVVRDLQAIARSSVKHREVGSFCDYDETRAVEMARVYDHAAAWHASHLGAPTFELRYEALVRNPDRVVGELAVFLGQSDPRAIHRALAAVGKQRALVRHYTNKLTHPGLLMETARKTLRSWIK